MRRYLFRGLSRAAFLGWAAFAASIAAACAKGPIDPGKAVETPQAIDLPEQPPLMPAAALVEEAPVIELDGGAEVELPAEWSGVVAYTLPAAEALQKAENVRRRTEALVAATKNGGPGGDGGANLARAYNQVNTLVDLTSRAYAGAYHAPDASAVDKVEALAAASELEMAWAARLDELGLTKTPASWRSNPSVPLTFEDVANGPVRRWRDEALALVALCAEIVRDANVVSPAAKRCVDMRKRYGRIAIAPRRARGNAKPDASANGCACAPGDPLCSTSMNGWCKP